VGVYEKWKKRGVRPKEARKQVKQGRGGDPRIKGKNPIGGEKKRIFLKRFSPYGN
jgi:hypothetical protein